MSKRTATKSTPKKRKSKGSKTTKPQLTPEQEQEFKRRLWRLRAGGMQRWAYVINAYIYSGKDRQDCIHGFDQECELLASMAEACNVLDPATFNNLQRGLTMDLCRPAVDTYNRLVHHYRRMEDKVFGWGPRPERPETISMPPPACSITKERGPTGNGGDEGVTDTPISLRDFVKTFCEHLAPNRVDSLVKALLDAALRGKVKLPDKQGGWKTGQKKMFRSTALIKQWPKYRNPLPGLPELKPEFKPKPSIS